MDSTQYPRPDYDPMGAPGSLGSAKQGAPTMISILRHLTDTIPPQILPRKPVAMVMSDVQPIMGYVSAVWPIILGYLAFQVGFWYIR